MHGHLYSNILFQTRTYFTKAAYTVYQDCLSIENRHTHAFLLMWPWLDDLGIQAQPRYYEDVAAYQKQTFWVKAFNS